MTAPKAGSLLIASVALTDGIFNQSVVLILDSDADGALGVILNEISQTPLDAVLAEWVPVVSGPAYLFHGGPVSPNGAICLASVADPAEEPPGWRRMFSTIGLLHLDTPIEIVRGAYRDLRIFAGYADRRRNVACRSGGVPRRLLRPAAGAVAYRPPTTAQRTRLLLDVDRGPRVELTRTHPGACRSLLRAHPCG
jgi:hypothetical protein